LIFKHARLRGFAARISWEAGDRKIDEPQISRVALIFRIDGLKGFWYFVAVKVNGSYAELPCGLPREIAKRYLIGGELHRILSEW